MFGGPGAPRTENAATERGVHLLVKSDILFLTMQSESGCTRPSVSCTENISLTARGEGAVGAGDYHQSEEGGDKDAAEDGYSHGLAGFGTGAQA